MPRLNYDDPLNGHQSRGFLIDENRRRYEHLTNELNAGSRINCEAEIPAQLNRFWQVSQSNGSNDAENRPTSA